MPATRASLPLAAIAVLCALPPGPAAAADPAPAGWAELAPLLGDWVGTGGGQPGEGTGGFTLRPDLGGKVLVRRNLAEYPATGDRPASRHEDLMVVFREGEAIRADYFDDEGHVIHYAVTAAPAEQKVVFLSVPGPGPRFRLTYAYGAADEIRILFEIAPPGAPESFRRYVEGTARRRGR